MSNTWNCGLTQWLVVGSGLLLCIKNKLKKSQTGGETPVMINLGEKTSLIPTLFSSCMLVIMTFSFVPSL
jgi:hypothetical protein